MTKEAKTLTEERRELERKPSSAERTWEQTTLKKALEASPERLGEFTTVSGVPVRRLYTPGHLPDFDPAHELGQEIGRAHV